MKAIDYSKKGNWYKIPEITKKFDTFYIYSTVYFGNNEGDPDYAPLDNVEMLEGVKVEHAIKSSVFEESTNVFIPYYRQAGLKIEIEAWMNTWDIDKPLLTGSPYGDITDALDYYFENLNGGRPFIIAGHSQGAAILRLALKGYFKEHPDYYQRMVAAYAIGYSITKEDLEANPHMKFATGETDTGVIISWHAEGPKNVETNSPVPNLVIGKNGISINPLNWKRDETYAPASLNKGSMVIDYSTGTTEIRNIDADAQVNLARGTVVTSAKAIPNEFVEIAGPQCYHQDDYSIFYNNIKDNVAKRAAAYLHSADLVVYGKIFTSEENKIVEAFAVKDGKYVYVGDKKGAESFIEAGKTEVVDYTGKGLVMPSCGNGHAHYSIGVALPIVGTVAIGATPDKFLNELVPAAVKKARETGAKSIFGFGWSFFTFTDHIPTRQQLDAICSDIPMYFADDEGHKGVANTLMLVKAGILAADGTVLKKDKDIRGGEIVMGPDGTPTGFLKEQAGTYTRSFLDNEQLYPVDVAKVVVGKVQEHMLSEGYTMYISAAAGHGR